MFSTRIFSIVVMMMFIFSSTINAQVSKISLGQETGEFVVQNLTVAPGDYQFEIANNGVDHEVGFVLAPKGKTDAANHIKAAYVKAPVKNGSTSLTDVVSLEAGEYVYFCPLNPTPQYNLTVKDPVSKVSLEQMTGKFTTESLTLTPGQYQFEINNNNVGKDVGFVLAPKGKTDAANHIKEAYVTAPVKNNTTGMTNVVTLTPGEYVYFCPLNPTEQYDLTVEEPVTKVSLEQMTGKFTTESLALAPGQYQFEINNNNVGKDVGFVLAPKGKTDAANHIKEAYVTAPVKNNTTGMTNVVTLTPGEYVYFCPLNPTKEYSLMVK